MALSIFTNSSSMASINAMNKANGLLSTAMERLGTGKRINSAADDAAGMQIASRLEGQSSGMDVAKRNISDATSMLQTAEGSFDEVTNIMYRMKDLATQAANDTNSPKDREALDSEFQELNKELTNIMGNTSYGGEKLLSGGKLEDSMTFQIGANAEETMTVDLSADLSGVNGAISDPSGGLASITLKTDASGVAPDYAAAITNIQSALEDVGTIRSSLGANINRLDHTASNLANMKDNTDVALGNIQDADFASEASAMSRNNMLAQTSMSMLKQSNDMSGLVMSLLGG